MTDQAVKTEFIANPMQKRFIESRARADLFSSRMGEGKSAALVWSVWYHTRHNPGARWALIRDTYENIRATTMQEFFKWFPPGIYGTWNESKKTYTWAPGIGLKGEVQFLGMDDPQDASKLQSREFAGFGMDEPAPASGSAGIDELVFDIAMTRLRQPGMNWYAVKLAENNPDESHWTHRKFVAEPLKGFVLWQPDQPENVTHLPDGYYADMRETLAHRPDLVRRFVDGKFGFQSIGKEVTPEWSDDLHLTHSLRAIPGKPLALCWDFGLNPTCIITQISPMGHWLILESYVGEEIGAYELIESVIKPTLAERFAKFTWEHIGDPAGLEREQSSSNQSAVKVIRKELGGTWRSGPRFIHERVEPLRSILTQTRNGRGLVQVDKEHAPHIWYALRGGWHYHVARTGVVSREPQKDKHSHPGDALGYGAAVLFPLGKLQARNRSASIQTPSFFGNRSMGIGKKGVRPPRPAKDGLSLPLDSGLGTIRPTINR